MDKIKPDYYKKDGKDLLDEFFNTLMTKEQAIGFCLGNAIKYLTRYDKKNGLEDLQKANEYLNRMLKYSKLIQDFTDKETNEFLSRIHMVSCNIGKIYNSAENEEDLKKKLIHGCLKDVKKALFEKEFSVEQTTYVLSASTQLDFVVLLSEKK